MSRILFFVLLALAIYIGWRYWRVRQSIASRAGARRAGESSPETMVRCDLCGLNLPQSEALASPAAQPARWYCCEDHRRQGSGA